MFYAKSRERTEDFDDRFEPFDRAEVTDPGGDGNSAPKPNSTEAYILVNFTWIEFIHLVSF